MEQVVIKLNETPSKLVEGAGYKGYIVDQGVIPASQVFEEAARGTTMSAETMRFAFDCVMASAYKGIQRDGRARMLGDWFKMMLTVRGAFDTKGAAFKEGRHAFGLKLLALNALKGFKRLFKVKVENAGPKVEIDLPDPLVFGADLVVTGSHLYWTEGDAIDLTFYDYGSTDCRAFSTTLNTWQPDAGGTSLTIPWSAIPLDAQYSPVGPMSLELEMNSHGGVADSNPQRHTLKRKVVKA